jgi:hypothetical protein
MPAVERILGLGSFGGATLRRMNMDRFAGARDDIREADGPLGEATH